MGMHIQNRDITSAFKHYGEDVENYLEKELGRGIPETGIFKHQIEAVIRTKEFLKNENKPNIALVLAPTGSGKTGIICLLPYFMRSERTLILTPSPLISDQIKEAVARPVSENTFFEKTRLFNPSVDSAVKQKFLPSTLAIKSTDDIQGIDNNLDLVIVNAQKLGANSKCDAGQDYDPDDPVSFGRITDFFKSFDLLIMDEAHHFPAKTWYNIKRRYENDNPLGKMVFLTASVMRLVKGKEKRILPENHEAYVVTKEQLEKDVIRPLGHIDFQHPEEIEEMKMHLVSELQNKLNEHDNLESRFMHQALILVRNKNSARSLAEIFNNGNPNGPARAIVGGTQLMTNVIKEFKQGVFRIGVVCNMLTEGFDNPCISICVIFRKVQSRRLFEQFIGRCLRRKRFGNRNEPLDCTRAVVLTYKTFEQSENFGSLNIVAETFSSDEEEDEEEDEEDDV